VSSLNNIKTCLLELESFDDIETFSKLQEEVRALIGQPGTTIGITPFFTVNNRFVFSATHNVNSIFLKNLTSEEEKETVTNALASHFENTSEPLILERLDEEALMRYSFLKHMQEKGWKSIIICPLKNYRKLIGILEIVSDQEGIPFDDIISKIDTALPLFELALNRNCATLDARIDKIIKEHFTAIQPSVEWRFTDAALSYLLKCEEEEDPKMEAILFPNVYPLYGAVDIRNSSTERNKSIQKDMLEQLEMISRIVSKAYKKTTMPLLDETNFKIKKYRHSISNIILSEDEIAINQFFKQDVVDLFEHLRKILPELDEDITKYFSAVNTIVDMIYHHRKDFDDSITFVNKTIARFIDKEQRAAQQIFPHYFERFVTDGVDFNIYIGQSITPQIPFNEIYLKNLKIWQLSTLAKAAQLSAGLLQQMPVPLETTQLILVHSYPINISFRLSERKFDVEGAYNIRYEIMKKRIDKVHIKDSNERLTQPGKIAIVYSQPKEAEEYREYIEYLTEQGLFTGEVHQFELEELQGIIGLKALRVDIKTESQNSPKAASLLSNA
jgi:hypothetical protein